MRIEEYFEHVRGVIATCLWVQTTTISFDQRSTYQGYMRGELYFVDGSILHIREYVDTESSIERFVYAYQYMDTDQRLVFRYDNAEHHRRLNLPTYPHHKHDGSETNIVATPPPDLEMILDEIGTRVDPSSH